MLTDELVKKVLNALSLSGLNPDQENLIKTHIATCIVYLKSIGVSENNLNSDLGHGCVIVGVTDLWNLEAGEIKFSSAFNVLAGLLTLTEVEDGGIQNSDQD